MKKLIIVLVLSLCASPLLAAQQTVTGGSGSAHQWSVQKGRINANFTELYGWEATIAANTAKTSFDSTSSTRLANTSGTNTGDQTLPTEAILGVDDLKTLSGVAGGSANLGAFTGSTIADNQTNKQAMQDLETAVEGAAGGHDAVTLGTANGLSLATQELSLNATTLMQVLDGLTWIFANGITVPSITSSAADGAHYSDVINTVTLTSTATLGRVAWLTDRFWIANGSNWTTRYFFDSSMTIPEANVHADIARDSEIETKYISGTENDYMGNLLNLTGIYAVDPTNHAVTIDNITPAAFTITEISIACNVDPTTELTLTFYHKAAGIGYGTPTTIEAVTTTVGVATITSGIDDATIPAGVKMFMTLSDPDAALLECAWKLEGDFD